MTFRFSGFLLRHVGFQRYVTCSGTNLRDALDALCADQPALRPILLDSDGQPRRTCRFALNDELIPTRLEQPLGPDDTIEIMTAVAGG